MTNFTNFRAVYDDLTNEVMRSRAQFFRDHLENWFSTLDTTEGIAEVVSRLERGVDFKPWYERAKKTHSGMAGSGKLDWPKDNEQRLGMQLALFRAFSRGAEDPVKFCLMFLYSGRNLNDMISGLTDQLFGPTARSLRRYLEQTFSANLTQIPASDRTVPLDHNRADYGELVSSIGNVKAAVVVTNDYEDTEDKEQRLAEIDAGLSLLKPARVRIEAIKAILGHVLRYLAKQFADTVVGKAASAAIKALCAFFGVDI